MAKYIRKPEIFEAVQVTKDTVYEGCTNTPWVNAAFNKDPIEVGSLFFRSYATFYLVLRTCSGVEQVPIGSWLIRGTQGAISVLSNHAFTQYFQPLQETQEICSVCQVGISRERLLKYFECSHCGVETANQEQTSWNKNN